MDYKKLSRDLHLACQTGDWKTCRDTTKNLFNQLPKSVVVGITFNFVKRYLPQFNQKHPQEIWAEARMRQIEQAIYTDYTYDWRQSYPEVAKHYGTPGDNNFVSSIGELWRIMIHWSDDEKVVELAVDALANVFMATTLGIWGAENPTLWNSVTNPKTEDDRLILSTYFTSDPKVKEMVVRLWLDFADGVDNWIENEIYD